MAARQSSDILAWDRNDDRWDEAVRQLQLSSHCQKIVSFAEGVLGGGAAKLKTPLVIGGFNMVYPIRLEGASGGFLVRLPCPNQVLFPEEKTLAEAATARYLTRRSRLPVPEVFYYGVNPGIGPYMIIRDLESRKPLSRALRDPNQDPDETAVLNPDISESKLKDLYLKMARCVLQLAQPTFPRIGALVETGPGSQCVMGRPITLNMSNMVHLSNIPSSIFPSKGTTYQTADKWYVALADMQIATLVFQRNDMVSSEDDCRTKYVARQLFRRLAKQGKLSTFGFAEDDWSARSKHAGGAAALLPMPDDTRSFRLWCDDFRPANVLVNRDDNVLGAIDWEFTYAAPAQFVLNSPWWLLLDKPETWEGGIEEWAGIYEGRLGTWLQALEEAEKEMEPGCFLLSAYMRESWVTGRFWLDYAAMRSWAFDAVYWKYLDERFFGERAEMVPTGELWKTRVHLLGEEERAAMEPLVRIKMEEMGEGVLVDDWDAGEARRRLESFLF